MRAEAFRILFFVIVIAGFGCQEKNEQKTVGNSQIDASIYIFKEMLDPSERRSVSIKSQEPMEIWVGVEYDDEDKKRVPKGGYMGALLTSTDSLKSIAGTRIGTTFHPKEGSINLEVRNESDVALVTVVFLREENIGIFRRYNNKP